MKANIQGFCLIFSEPHAYILPMYYDKDLSMPIWNYISIPAYGQGTLITEMEKTFDVLEATIDNFESSYKQQWSNLPLEYKLKMLKGIVAFEIHVTDLQAKKKLSQNRTSAERMKIVYTLSNSSDTNENLIAEYMKRNEALGK